MTCQIKPVTVAQLIEALQKLDQDAVVYVGKEITSGYDTWMRHEPIDLADMDVHDYTGDEWKKYPHSYGKKILKLEAQ